MKKAIAECNFTDQLLSAASYMITHKGVISAMLQYDWMDWLYY